MDKEFVELTGPDAVSRSLLRGNFYAIYLLGATIVVLEDGSLTCPRNYL